MRRTATFACVMVLLVFAAQLPAADNTFQYGGIDYLWSNPGNWSAGWLPKSDENVYIGDNLTCTLDSDAGEVERLRLGTAGGTGKLIINDGADLFVDSHMFIAMFKDAEIVQNGGYFKIPDTNIPHWQAPGYNGTFTLKGGELVRETSNSEICMHEEGSQSDTALFIIEGGTATLGKICMYGWGGGGGVSNDCLAEFRVSGGITTINEVHLALSHAKATDSTAEFHVIGSAATIAVNTWNQTVGDTAGGATIESILHCEADSGGITTIAVANTATFASGTTVIVERGVGVTPPQKGDYDLLTAAGGITDNGLDITTNVDSTFWSVTVGTNAITATFLVHPGDASLDDSVDGADYTLYAAKYGQAGGWGDGDFNNDGVVDGADYTIYAANYGKSGGAIPEPITLTLLGLGGLAMLRRRRLNRDGYLFFPVVPK